MASCSELQAQHKGARMFQKGTLQELNKFAVEQEKDFFFFIWEDETEALTTYYRDTIFDNRLISNQMKDRFICISAKNTSEIGVVFSKQLRHTEFPAMMFVGWKKGDELFTLEGRLEIDQFLDQLERVEYRKRY
jgi:hypothetical protein